MDPDSDRKVRQVFFTSRREENWLKRRYGSVTRGLIALITAAMASETPPEPVYPKPPRRRRAQQAPQTPPVPPSGVPKPSPGLFHRTKGHDGELEH